MALRIGGAMLKPFGIPLVLFALVAPVSGAVSLSATHDNNTLRSAAGMDVVQSNGGVIALKESTSNQGNSRAGFFKFNAVGLSEAVDGNTATLNLTVSADVTTNFSMRIYVLNAGVAGYDWTEENITWNNSPGLASTSGTFYLNNSNVSLIGSTFSVPNGTTAGSPISVSLGNWSSYRQSDQTLTFIAVITSQSSGTPQLSIASSENATEAYRPTLNIVPEPSSLTLAALSALGLLRRRR